MTMIKLDLEDSEALAMKMHVASYTGGSSRGMHFYADAARCGMRAMLNEKQRAERLQDHANIPPLEDMSKEKKEAFTVGSGYHKLHEMVRIGELELKDHDQLVVNSRPFSASHLEALRLFNGWMAHWRINLWGKPIAVEAELVTQRTFPQPDGEPLKVTAMPDLVTELTDTAAASARLGQFIEPGRYIIDFKTSDMPYDHTYYKGGLQALWYPFAWNELYPDKPVKGIIFDAIHKFGRRKDKSVTLASFDAVYSWCDPSAREALAGMITQGIDNIRRAKVFGVGNRSECMQFSFSGIKTCQYFGSGCANEA